MESPSTETKTDRELEARMQAVAGDDERVEILSRARIFKRSWIELAEALCQVYERKSWKRWGYDSFDLYCKNELRLTPSTATKLLGSYRFLRNREPSVIERVQADPHMPIPSQKAVDFVARAEERGAAPPETMEEIKRAAFEEGAEAPSLTRRFKTVAFPVSEAEKEEKMKRDLATTARKLAALVTQAEVELPEDVAVCVEDALGRLLSTLQPEMQQEAA